jgi:hypothetical protein
MKISLKFEIPWKSWDEQIFLLMIEEELQFKKLSLNLEKLS